MTKTLVGIPESFLGSLFSVEAAGGMFDAELLDDNSGSGTTVTTPAPYQQPVPMRPGPGGFQRGTRFQGTTQNPASIAAGAGISCGSGFTAGAQASTAVGAGLAASQSAAAGAQASVAAGAGLAASQSAAAGAQASTAAAAGTSVGASAAMADANGILPITDTPPPYQMTIPMRPGGGGLSFGQRFSGTTVIPAGAPTVVAGAGISAGHGVGAGAPAAIAAGAGTGLSVTRAAGGPATVAAGAGIAAGITAAMGAPTSIAAGAGVSLASSIAFGSQQQIAAGAGISAGHGYGAGAQASTVTGAGVSVAISRALSSLLPPPVIILNPPLDFSFDEVTSDLVFLNQSGEEIMDDLRIRRGELLPIVFTLTANRKPVDLSNVAPGTLKWTVRRPGKTPIIDNKDLTIIAPATNGRVSYLPLAGEVSVNGKFRAEAVAIFTDGTRRKFPGAGLYRNVIIEESLLTP